MSKKHVSHESMGIVDVFSGQFSGQWWGVTGGVSFSTGLDCVGATRQAVGLAS